MEQVSVGARDVLRARFDRLAGAARTGYADSRHPDGALARAAVFLAAGAATRMLLGDEAGREARRVAGVIPAGRRAALVEAAALIIAEIERIDEAPPRR